MNASINKSPFKFLDSFTQDDKDIFFGREPEVEEVYAKVFQSKILLVYGASGTGKSSIINCGLANKFQASDWLPIHIRRTGNILRSMARQINKLNLSSPEEFPNEAVSPEEIKASLSSVYLDHFKPIYLVFDQFEELFIFGQKEEWQNFIEVVRYLIDSELELRLIFVIRGEYLEFLAEFEDMIPGFFDNRVRIERMSRAKAKKSISGPCQKAGIELQKGFEDQLLAKLTTNNGRVELTFLQVFLDRIYRNAQERTPAGEIVKFTAAEIEQLGQIGDVLAEFLDEQIFKMKDPVLTLAVLKTLVSLQGTKLARSISEIQAALAKSDIHLADRNVEDILQSLVTKRILNDKNEDGRFELRHDSLAFKIYEKISLQEKERLEVQQFLELSLKEFQKRNTLLSEEDLTYIAPHERKLNLNQATLQFIERSRRKSKRERNKRRSRVIVVAIIAVLGVAAVIGYLNSEQQKNRADKLAIEAQAESREAKRQESLADEQRNLALQNQQEAEIQALEADKAREDAEAQQLLAEEAQSQALDEREAAIISSRRAKQSAQEALRQRELAEQSKKQAEHLRRLGLAKELAIRSTRVSSPLLKSQLALYAFRLNDQEQGFKDNAEIHQALLSALEANSGKDYYKVLKYPGGLTGVSSSTAPTLLMANDGKLLQLNDQGGLSPVYLDKDARWKSMDREGDLIALGNHKGEMLMIDVASKQLLWSLNLSDKKLILSAGGIKLGELLSFSDRSLFIVSLDGKLLSTQVFSEKLVGVARSDNSDLTWVLGESGSVWRMAGEQSSTPQLVTKLNGSFTALSLSPDGNRLALGNSSGLVLIWDTEKANIEMEFPGHRAAITDVCFHPSGNELLSGSYDRSVKVWNLNSAAQAPRTYENLGSWVSAVEYSQNDRLSITCFNGELYNYPISAVSFASELCTQNLEALTDSQWSEYIAKDIKKFPMCYE